MHLCSPVDWGDPVDTVAAAGPAGPTGPPAGATRIDQNEAECANPFEHSVQRRLVQFTTDNGDFAVADEIHSGERVTGVLIRSTRQPDLVTWRHEVLP
jgi:hypothetical protein